MPELVGTLRNARTQAAANRFFSDRCQTLAEVVKLGVGGNTFRAFRNLPVRPSTTFREWTVGYLEHSLSGLLQISTAPEFAAYVHQASLALCHHWRQMTRSETGYGRAAKLLNLVLKKLACLERLTPLQRRTLISLLHVPLDSYTIVGLRDVAPELAIPRSATMKFIQTPEQYADMQVRLTAIAAEAGVPAINYDILAWDLAH